MTSPAKDELLTVANQTGVQETGGSHNQKGIDFQRYWTILRMVELESQGVDDFLILVEAIQDISELDSPDQPTKICLYQLKKKDRKEWTWNELTKLHQPKTKKAKSNSPPNNSTNVNSGTSTPDPNTFTDSPLGKLYSAYLSINKLEVTAKFLSNRGTDLPLNGGGNVATSVVTPLELLDPEYIKILKDEMIAISNESQATESLSKIFIGKAALEIDSLKESMIGHVFNFLSVRSPNHVAQASSFLDALMAVISPLGSKTDKCHTFEQLCQRHGYSKKQFIAALSDLQATPDILDILEQWLNKLDREGLNFMEITAIRKSAAGIFTRQLMRVHSQEEISLINDCDEFIKLNPIQNELKPIFELAFTELSKTNTGFKKSEILAQFALRAIILCVDQI